MLSKLSPKMRAWVLVLCGAAFAVALPPLVAYAQQEVMMTGQDSAGTTRVVRTDTSGNIITSGSSSTPSGAAAGTHGACKNTTMNVGTTGTACPATPRTDRASVMIQLNQSGETLRVTTDGTTTATAALGAKVTDGSTYSDSLAGTVSANCRCSAATCEVVIVECP